MATTAEDALRVAVEHEQRLSFPCATFAVHRLAKLCSSSGPLGSAAGSHDLGRVLRRVESLFQVERNPLPSDVCHLIWAIGKLEVASPTTAAILARAALFAPRQRANYSVEEIASALWGFARVLPAFGHPPRGVTRAAGVLVQECLQRHDIDRVSPHTHSVGLYAAVRLQMPLPPCESLLRRCGQALLASRPCGAAEAHEWCPQGLANVAWAAAKICSSGAAAPGCALALLVCATVADRARARLEAFKPMELSMMAWAFATAHRRGAALGLSGGRASASLPQAAGLAGVDVVAPPALSVIASLPPIAACAHAQLNELSPQSIANVSWALAAADVWAAPEAFDFITAAAALAARVRFRGFEPQAIANLCWATRRLGGTFSVVEARQFVRMAARVALERLHEFAWQDRAGIIIALAGMPCSAQEHTVMTLAGFLAGALLGELYRLMAELAAEGGQRALHEACVLDLSHLTAQVALNIAVACARLQCDRQLLSQLRNAIASIYVPPPGARPWLCRRDLRQWAEVQRRLT